MPRHCPSATSAQAPGAGAALWAAAADSRTEVARSRLPRRAARSRRSRPWRTSLRRRCSIVGGRDDVVLDLNRRAQAAHARAKCRTRRRSRRHASVRGTGHPRTGGEAGLRLVRRPLEPIGRTTLGSPTSLGQLREQICPRRSERLSECEPSTENTYRNSPSS